MHTCIVSLFFFLKSENVDHCNNSKNTRKFWFYTLSTVLLFYCSNFKLASFYINGIGVKSKKVQIIKVCLPLLFWILHTLKCTPNLLLVFPQRNPIPLEKDYFVFFYEHFFTSTMLSSQPVHNDVLDMNILVYELF